MLYQLSYSRVDSQRAAATCRPERPPGLGSAPRRPVSPTRSGRPSGGEGNRTPDLVNAIHALSQLSYAPVILGRPGAARPEQGKLPSRFWGVKQTL